MWKRVEKMRPRQEIRANQPVGGLKSANREAKLFMQARSLALAAPSQPGLASRSARSLMTCIWMESHKSAAAFSFSALHHPL